MFFKSEEDRKEFHQSLLRDHECGIKFIEGVIKSNRDMAEIYKSGTFPGDKDRSKTCEAEAKKWEIRLKEAMVKLEKAQIKYNDRYLTIKEKAFNKGLTVISGGLCKNA